MDIGGSGGPIWVNQGNKQCIIAVNSYHKCLSASLDTTGRCTQVYKNNGVKIDSTIRKFIHQFEL